MRHLFFSRQSHESQSTVCIKSAFRFPPCFACWCIVAVPIYRDVFTAAASQHRPGRLAAASRRPPRGLHRRCEMRRATTACPATSSAVPSYGPRHIRAGIVVKELTWAPKFHQNQSKRPEVFRRCAPEPCKSTRRETHHHRFPHRYAPKELTWTPCHKTLLFPLGRHNAGPSASDSVFPPLKSVTDRCNRLNASPTPSLPPGDSATSSIDPLLTHSQQVLHLQAHAGASFSTITTTVASTLATAVKL